MAVANVTDIGSSTSARAPAGFRTKPHNLDLEWYIIGSLIANNRSLALIRPILRAEHFYDPGNAALYERIAERVANGESCEIAVLFSSMDAAGREAMFRLAQANAGVSPEQLSQWTNEIIRLWQRRRQIDVAETLVNASYDLDVPFDDWRRRAVEDLSQVEAASPQPKIEPFEFLSSVDICDQIPLREFLVDKWIPVGCVSSLYGSGGTGKSFLSMMLAMCVAAGRDWLGHFACQKAVVMAIMCEDDEDELRRRRNKIASALHITQEDIEGYLWLTPRVGELNALMEFPQGIATRTQLFYRTVGEAKRVAARLVILDNAAQLFNGNENDRAQVTAFLNSCAGIARQINGAVLLVGHPPKMANTEFSGSTAWDAVVRSRMLFKRIDQEDDSLDEPINVPQRYSLELVKSNYAKRFGIELQENSHGIVEYLGELARFGKPKIVSRDDRIFSVFQSLFMIHRRPITQDEIADECIRIGMWSESAAGSPARRKQHQRVREAMNIHHRFVDIRDGGSYALKP